MDIDKNKALEMAEVDAACWAEVKCIKLQKGVWSFENRPYLVEPMQWSMLHRSGKAPRRKCEMKGTQGGFSETEVNESLHGCIYGHYPAGVMYLFPTTDDVREFSKSRFGPLIAANPLTIGKFVRDTDTVSLKRISDACLFLRGANLTQKKDLGGNESTKLRSITVDKVVFDELDLMDLDVVAKAKGRMGDSTVKQEVYISNPTIPDAGIHTQWKLSDQRHWFRRCRSCGTWTCAEIEFPNCIGQHDDGTGYVACKKCKRPIGLSPGQWVPAVRENSGYMWGYHWSQLTSPNNDPYEILEEFSNPTDDNISDTMRLRLGKPHVRAEDRLTPSQVLARCGNSPQLNSHKGPCAMGIDVKRHKNVVIGIRSGRDRYKILRVDRVSGGPDAWDDIKRLAHRFNVRSCVVDIRPYEDSARKFQNSVKFKTWLCEYSESTPVGTVYNDKTGLVKVNRTEILDATHRLVVSETQLELPNICPELKQFALECSSIAKVEEINKRTRTTVFRYHKLDTAPDDYRHALGYFYLAASGGKIGVAENSRVNRRPRHAKNDYVRC